MYWGFGGECEVSNAWTHIIELFYALVCTESVENNVSFPIPESTLMACCLRCYVQKYVESFSTHFKLKHFSLQI